MVPKSYVENLAVSPEIVEEDLAATDVGDLVDWTRVHWLEFFVENIFHIAQSRTLYLCTFLASKIGHVAKI
jgi:hypothetical protein